MHHLQRLLKPIDIRRTPQVLEHQAVFGDQNKKVLTHEGKS